MPRPLVANGFPGIGQERFPEAAKELGRRHTRTVDVTILRYTETNSAGATRTTYVPDDDPVLGRIDPVGSGRTGGTRNDAVDESSSHLVTLDYGVGISVKDRVEIEGQEWLITSVRTRSGSAVERFEVRQA